MVEGTSDLVTRVDGDGRFVYVNQAAEKILGVKPKACMGLSAFEFVHPEDRKKTQEWFDDCVHRQVASATIENRQVSRTGEVFHVLCKSNFNYDDSRTVIEIDAITRDITERRRMEKSLRESENRYKQLMHNVSDCVYICKFDGHFKYVNHAITRLIGLAQEDFVGKHFLSIVHPDYHKKFKKFYLKQVEDNIENTYLEFPLLIKDNEVMWAGQTVRMIRNNDIVIYLFNHFAR